MKLRKCFCGGKPKHYPLDYDDVYNDELSHIECESCGFATVSYWNGNHAMRAWNYLQREKINGRTTATIGKPTDIKTSDSRKRWCKL